jgi:quercetin dioxygenase-like cupin family protein
VRRLIVGGGAAVLAGSRLQPVAAQESTPAAGECVATAPPAQEGVGFASLLVGGIVRDMPAAPVDVHISRFTLEPGVSIPSETLPYPSLVYVETGELTCPDNPGKLMYGPDGEVMYETTGKAEWHTCTPGMTWYVPAGIADAAVNEGSELMSALFMEFVPVEETATPTT